MPYYFRIIIGSCGLLALISCAHTPVAPVDDGAAYLKTNDEIKTAGLSVKDINVMHAFLRYINSGEDQTRDCVPANQREETFIKVRKLLAESLDPANYHLYNDNGLNLVLSYSPSADSLNVVAREKFYTLNGFELNRKGGLYEISTLEGCLVYSITLDTSKGRPYKVVETDYDLWRPPSPCLGPSRTPVVTP